ERRDIGLAFSRFSHSYTMATTEAGQLPLYSGWRVLDAWGLNDSWVAHHGLTDEYLVENHPEVIVVAPWIYGSRSWQEMTAHLERFAKARDYVLVTTFLPVEYYVAPGCPDSVAIVESISNAGRPTTTRAPGNR